MTETTVPPEAPEKPPEKPPEEPKEPRTPPAVKPPPNEPGPTQTAKETEYVECPDCDALVKENKLGAHRWRAHKIDRRATQKQPEATEEPRTPPKKDPPKDSGTAPKQKAKSRWAEVGWK